MKIGQFVFQLCCENWSL